MHSLNSTNRISIIVTTYESPDLLEYTLDSITKQSMNLDEIEVIVVSHKNNPLIDVVVSNYQNSLNVINLSYNEDLWNEPAARNMALEYADAFVCLLLRSGSLLSSTCVQEHYNTHATNLKLMATIGFTYGNCGRQEYIDNVMQLVKNYGTDDLISYFFANKMYHDVRDESYLRFNHKIHYLPAPWAFFSSSNISINKSSFQDENIYDENFTLGYGYEDLDLGFRLYQKGAKIFLNREAEVVNYPQSSQVRIDRKMSMDAEYFFNKHNHEIIQWYDIYGELALNDQIINRSYDDIMEAM